MPKHVFSRRFLIVPVAFEVIFFVAPLCVIAAYSFMERDVYGQVNASLSFEGWSQSLNGVTLRILGRTLLLASLVTAISLAVAYPSALRISALPAHRKHAVTVLVSFTLLTSILLRIYGWMNLIPFDWRGSLFSVTLVMVVNYLPFMLLPILRALERMDPALPSAAMDLNATPWQTLRLVIWPATLPGVIAGCALVFIPATGDYLVPHFIGDGKVSTLGTLIVQQFMERRNWPYAAAACIWLLCILIVPMLFWLAHLNSAKNDAPRTV